MQTSSTVVPLNAPATGEARASRVATLAYGILSYTVGVTGLCWLIAASLGLVAFTGGPASIDATGAAIAFNLGFVVLFGVQHAIMARPAFKQRWTRIIPASIERSTFVLVTGVIVAGMLWLWQPLPTTVWAVQDQTLTIAMRSVAALGWAYLFAASFAIDHFELFGLKQVWRSFRGADAPQVPFVSAWMYRFDRHPLMTGMLIGLWCTPTMTLGQLVLAAGLTTYMVLGVLLEERSLVAQHGDSYRAYRRTVAALVPFPGRRE